MDRKLGESHAKAVEAQAEADGKAAAKYAGDKRIVDRMRKEHASNKMARQAFDKGYKSVQDEQKKKN